MELSYDLLKKIAENYGESFYLLDSKQFRRNFLELQEAFRKIYPKTYIAYSYKTNYIPALCKIVDELGGYAEVVSDMEVEIAKRVGVSPEKIIFNGPYKDWETAKTLLLQGGCVNIDSLYEIEPIQKLAEENTDKMLHIGIRCNFPINDGLLSRFGIDTDSEVFQKALLLLHDNKNIILEELHCHFSSRKLETWPPRAQGMIDIVKNQLGVIPEHIDLGGGLFGKMGEALKMQFDSYIPCYEEYAKAVATIMNDAFSEEENKPKLFIEPGSALVGDAMKFVAKVINIKEIRGKSIGTVLGSIYNINPTLNTKNPPIAVYHKEENNVRQYKDLDFGGYTCIESDYLYRHYNGELAVGDYVVFDNVGSYSIVLKPPFILPNFAIVDCSEDVGDVRLIKRAEVFDDLFHTYMF